MDVGKLSFPVVVVHKDEPLFDFEDEETFRTVHRSLLKSKKLVGHRVIDAAGKVFRIEDMRRSGAPRPWWSRLTTPMEEVSYDLSPIGEMSLEEIKTLLCQLTEEGWEAFTNGGSEDADGNYVPGPEARKDIRRLTSGVRSSRSLAEIEKVFSDGE